MLEKGEQRILVIVVLLAVPISAGLIIVFVVF